PGSLISGAGAALPSHASADGAASLAYGRPRDAYTVDSGPAQTTSDSHLCYHIVRRSKRSRPNARADVAIVKAKPAIAINLSIVFLPRAVQLTRGGFFSRLGRISDVYWQTCIRP